MPESTQRPTLSPLRIRVAPEEVVLHVWGLRDLGWYGWLNLLLAGAASYGAAWITGWPWAGWGVLVLLVVILWRFWLPIRFELGPQGIAQTALGRTTQVPWTSIMSFQVNSRGVLLYADAVLTPLSPARALYLPWCNQRDAVLRHVEYYLTTWTQAEMSSRQS